MPRTILSELQNANHWWCRLHTFELGDFDRIAPPGASERVPARRPRIPPTWVRAGEDPDKRDQTAKNWHDALWRVFPTELLSGAGNRRQVVSCSRRLHGRQQRRLDRDRAPRAACGRRRGAGGRVYARTEHTAGWAKIPSGGRRPRRTETDRRAVTRADSA
jgi:hypothetical protein